MSKVSTQMMEHRSQILMARGSEVEQWTPYLGLQPILCHILKLASHFQFETLFRGVSESVNSSTTKFGKGKDYTLKEFEAILVECGENPLYAPLLAQIEPWLKFESVEAVERLTTSAKNSLDASVFLKLLSRYLSKGDSILVLDDA
ncbi:hypothetical protein HDU97_005485 [Phlyctochytrium planicorne]|nr:hypothetical protein HDU97_005485 [Phlyctochytrium planicorne]